MNEHDEKIEDATIEAVVGILAEEGLLLPKSFDNDMRMFDESVKEWLRKNCAPCQRCLKIFFRKHLKDCSVIQMNVGDKFVPIKICQKCEEKLPKLQV